MTNKNPLEIKILCIFSFLLGLFGVFHIWGSYANKILIIFPILVITIAVGLLFQKGWAYNFMVFLASTFFVIGMPHLFKYFFNGDLRSRFPGFFDVACGTLLAVLLLRKRVRTLYPKNPYSLAIIGLIIGFFGWHGRFDIIAILSGLIAITLFVYAFIQIRQVRS